MQNVYDEVPLFEDERFLLRFVEKKDAESLLNVYGDKNSLPFFNSDNCHGDNFYYPTLERMEKAIDFWLESYKSKWFVRWAVIDKDVGNTIGTAELFRRAADDDFAHAGVLRLDVGSGYERADSIAEIASLIVPHSYGLFGTERIITKVPVYAVERAAAFAAIGFEKSASFLIGTQDGYAYKDYWEKKR